MLEMGEPMKMDGTAADDFRAISDASQHLGSLMYTAAVGAFGSSILQWLAVIAAIYLFVVNRTEWRTNILTSLLVPYVTLNLPNFVFKYFRGEIGLWVAFVAVVLKLFFPQHFPDHADLPAWLVILMVTLPNLIVGWRFHLVGVILSLLIGFYLMYEHIRNAGGCRQAVTDRGLVAVGIVLLFVAPFWTLLFDIIL